MNQNTSEPAQILVVLSKKGFIDCASMLRRLAQTETSNRRNKFSDETKSDCIEQLRSSYENQRKLFLFSLLNSAQGLYAASQVVEAGPADGLLSKKESKKLSKLKKLQKEKKFQYPRKDKVDKSRSLCFRCNQVFIHVLWD